MNTNILSTEGLGDSRTIRKSRQSARFSEPEQRVYTTHVEGGEQHVASSKDAIVESTLVTENEQEGSEDRRAGNHDKNSVKQRGRPRVDITGSTQAEKRRTQLRLAQRTFKHRQEKKIKLLESKASNIEEAISQTGKAFHDFQEVFLKSNVLDQAPELSHSFRSASEAILSLRQGIDNNNPVPSPLKIRDSDIDRERIERSATEIQGHSASEKKGVISRRERRYSFEPSLPLYIPGTPMKDIFIERFIDKLNTNALPSRRNGIWLNGAAEARFSSTILTDTFECVSTAEFGLSIGDPRIMFTAQKLYIKVLNALQRALRSPSESRYSGTLFSITLLAEFERIVNASEKAMVNHMMGALKVVEYRGPQSYITRIEHQFFIDHRPYWVMTAIGCRSPTFLTREEWKTIPWSANPSSKDFQQLLLDHLADIPTLLTQFDILVEAETNGMTYSQTQGQRDMFCGLLTDLEYCVRRWKREQADPRDQPFEGFLVSTPHNILPNFQCHDVLSGAIITPALIVYPNADLALAHCWYYLALLVVSLYDIRTEGRIQPDEKYILACSICRSMEYCVQTVRGPSSMLSLFALRVAYDTFFEESIEKRWAKDVFLMAWKASNLQACATLMQEFSVLNGRDPSVMG